MPIGVIRPSLRSWDTVFMSWMDTSLNLFGNLSDAAACYAVQVVILFSECFDDGS